jgi:hypothetical protein
MKSKRFALIGLCAALFGAGIGMSSAQVLDVRCQSCETFFRVCIAACDAEGGEGDCYRPCFQQRRACVATFCP